MLYFQKFVFICHGCSHPWLCAGRGICSVINKIGRQQSLFITCMAYFSITHMCHMEQHRMLIVRKLNLLQRTRGSAIAERPTRCSVLVEVLFTVVRITQTNHMLAWGALSATATFYSATCIVLYTYHSTILQRARDAVGVISRLLYQCTTIQPTVLMATGP